jgi:hypothetical protein
MKLKDITKWASPKIRTIQVNSDVCPVPLKLTVRKFVPIPEDSLCRAWMDGKTKKFWETTPYAILNMSVALDDMRKYVAENVWDGIDYCIRDSDDFVKMTYKFAKQQVQRAQVSTRDLFFCCSRPKQIDANRILQTPEEKRLLGNSFRLWFAVRRTGTREHISGSDKLDMAPEMTDRSFPLFGKVPLPQVMIQQLDMILILGILDPLKKQVLEDMQKILMNRNPRTWLTIYLITFIASHSCALVTNENYSNARKHGLRVRISLHLRWLDVANSIMKRRYSIPNYIADRHHSANVYLSHYHYITQPCNPFEVDWKKRQTTPFGDMTPEEVLFLKKTKKMFDAKGSKVLLH